MAKEKKQVSAKHAQISKAQSTMAAVIAGAAFVVVFSLVGIRALLGQRSYQARVIAGKEEAVEQLKKNVEAAKALEASYAGFVGAEQNVLGGSKGGNGDRDGDNARIVLDALPSKYDFPALTTSLEKLLTDGGYTIEGIEGTDDELNQQNTASPNPVPIEMPFQVSVSGQYAAMRNLVLKLERSIRPMQVETMELNGSDANLQMSISAKTYYQPETNLTIESKKVQ